MHGPTDQREQYIHRRKGRYMAQVLEEFEEKIEPLLPADVAESYKAMVRRKLNALAVDCYELIKLEGNDQRINGHAQDLRDRTFPDARRANPPAGEPT